MLAVAAIPLVVVLALLAGCTSTSMTTSTMTPAGSDPIFPDATVAPLVGSIQQLTLKSLPDAALAPGLIPPTNRWFSGLVFGTPSMPVFPLPLSFQLTDAGFAFGVPTVTTHAKGVIGGFTAIISANVGADSQTVTAYDTASVTITQKKAGRSIGHTVIAEGSPFVSFTAEHAVDVTLGAGFTTRADGAYTVTSGGSTYGLVTTGKLGGNGRDLTLSAGQTATWFTLPTGGKLADFVAAAKHPIVSTSVEYGLSGGRSTTSMRYRTTDGSPTIVAAMPVQYAALGSGVSCVSGTWASIYGELKACSVDTLSWSTKETTPTARLDLSGLTAAQRQALARQVATDFVATPAQPADTYFGGKWLGRLATLMSIASQVGADNTAKAITAKLVAALDEWTAPNGCSTRSTHCFVYDPAAKGIVGQQPSFGSDEFNDHHFHYGYFLSAAGMVAATDPSLAKRWAPVMNLVAADLATSGSSRYFPERRVFDAYAGHSWASGTAPFGDGNNQESTSEAVNAWNGLALWAAATKQNSLRTEATWMLSSEITASNAYSTNFPLDATTYTGFDHTVLSLQWGGKRDYATFFSAEPSAILGILVLPLAPVGDYLGEDPSRVTANLADAVPNGYDVTFGDYLLMYRSLAGPEAAASALTVAEGLDSKWIDDGNSRSSLLAWIMTHLHSR